MCSDGFWGTVCGVDALNTTAICHVAGYAGGIELPKVAFLIIYFVFIIQYQSTLSHQKCLEMMTFQFSTNFSSCNGCETNAAIAVKTHTLILIVVKSLLLECDATMVWSGGY